IQFNERFYSPSTLHFAVDHTKLYALQVANAQFDQLIKMLLRLYGVEMFSGFVKIDESVLARGLKVSQKAVVDQLMHLHALQTILYTPMSDKPQVTYVTSRQDADHLPVDHDRLAARRALVLGKMKDMIAYVENDFRCR